MNTLTRAHKRAVVASEREIGLAEEKAKAALERAEKAETELEKLRRIIAAMKAGDASFTQTSSV
jgi:hypothetical protein